MAGTLIIKPGTRPVTCVVSWSGSDGTQVPEEERILVFDGKEAEPQVIRDKFDAASSNADFLEIGKALWGCIAGGTAGAEWTKAMDKAPGSSLLDLTEAVVEWGSLPWETLHNGKTYLGIRTALPLARLVRWPANRDVKPTKGWPHRLLIVCGEDLDDKNIHVRQELEAIEDGIWQRRREIICRVLIRPGNTQLGDVLSEFQPHILHFIGHGTGNALQIRKNNGKHWFWDAGEMDAAFNSGHGPLPHLVFLNACLSGADQNAMTSEGQVSLARMFLDLGVPAVIGMAGNVTGQAAEEFSRQFYHHWLDGRAMDAAFACARLEVSRTSEAGKIQAFLGRLVIADSPAKLKTWPPPEKIVESGLKHPRLANLGEKFVARNDERFDIFKNWLLDDASEAKNRPANSKLLIVYGESGTGKSDVLAMVFKAMAAEGWLARRHDLVPGSNWLKVLRQLTTGCDQCCMLDSPLPKQHFADFEEKAKTASISEEGDVKAVFAAWREGLKNLLAGGMPVAIALDQLTIAGAPSLTPNQSPILPEWLGFFCDHLLKPVIEGEFDKKPLLLVLVMNKAEHDAFANLIANRIGSVIEPVRIAEFAPHEAARALRQYVRHLWPLIQAEKLVPMPPDKLEKVLKGRDQAVEDFLGFRGDNMVGSDLPLFISSYLDRLKHYQLLR